MPTRTILSNIYPFVPFNTSRAPGGNCHPSYLGACLLIGVGDYDCAGGNENGPNYVYTQIRVCGNDEFRLNSNPGNDNIGCDLLPAPVPFPQCP
jgi:hypothetical protein